MTDTEAIALFKCLADKTRLNILKSLAIEDMYVERLAQRLDLSPSTISFHLKKLSEAGAVTSYKSQYYTMYSLRRKILETSILATVLTESDEAALQRERDEAYRQKVIDSFFEYGRLISIPAQRKKKRIILEVIAQCFDLDRDYREPEVNALIGQFHEDHCTLRRDMISEQLLTRENGIYRRAKTE